MSRVYNIQLLRLLIIKEPCFNKNICIWEIMYNYVLKLSNLKYMFVQNRTTNKPQVFVCIGLKVKPIGFYCFLSKVHIFEPNKL